MSVQATEAHFYDFVTEQTRSMALYLKNVKSDKCYSTLMSPAQRERNF